MSKESRNLGRLAHGVDNVCSPPPRRELFITFNVEKHEDTIIICTFAHEYRRYRNLLAIIMSHEERKSKMAATRAVNSKKPAMSRFMRWARAHKGAFVINDPELKAQLASFE